VELAAEEKQEISRDTEGRINREILGKRESVAMVTSQNTKKVKVTMGEIYETNPESKQMEGVPEMEEIAESKVTDHGQAQIGENGENKVPEMGNMHPMMHGMMYPINYGRSRDGLTKAVNMENAQNLPPGVNNMGNMVPNQMYPGPFYYPHPYMMNQGMMPPFQQMNMGFQYPQGYPMNMGYVNQPNLMENLGNEGQKEKVKEEDIHKENPLKVIRKVNNNTNQMERIKSESEESEKSEEKEEEKKEEEKKENTVKHRIDFNQSDDEQKKESILVKSKINAIPNEKVEEDVKKKEEIIAKELTEKEILMNKVKNQKALEEISLDKGLLKILVKIAKEIPKRKKYLFREKIKWSLLERVPIIPKLTKRKKFSKPDYQLG
jgi:hypothetical protein